MSQKITIVFAALFFSVLNTNAQNLSTKGILDSLKKELKATDADTGMLVSPTGFNVFMQKKALNYLTGVSDLSLAKFYSTYSTDNDKLILGFNVPGMNPYTNRLAFVFNPIIEADVKNNFTSLYKDKKWKNNIRAGLKITYLLPRSTLNFWPDNIKSHVNDLKILRAQKYAIVSKRLTDEETAKTTRVTLLDGTTTLPSNNTLTQTQMRNKENEAYEEIGKAEAEYLEKEKTYTWMQTGWVSAWAFFPVTEAEKYISNNNATAFQKTKFKLWEVNLQFTYLLDIAKVGTFYASPWIKQFQNNSANADLMTNVDYGQYSQFPGANPLNLALLETNKAYIGDYKEFVTTNVNIQIVYITPWQNTLIKPGLSFRYEKNFGDYNPTNLRFGLPLAIQGRDKPINLELQYRINDINNYKNVADHVPTKTVGISLGLPIALLYK
ncbi:MAG: hypothetical protein WC615_22675 [Mucilaginibacter sp.]|jgi:hypothetical protein|uniref:hypothetical protein n=1 Tax=Mucilaginibacter sp. TaxID=1882438 RepID=UPI0035626831